MSCLLATFAACFSLSGIYVDASVHQTDARAVHIDYETRITQATAPNGGPVLASYNQPIIKDTTGGTLGRFVIGFDITFPKLSIFIEAGHKSDPFTSRDSGENFAALGIRARPFAR